MVDQIGKQNYLNTNTEKELNNNLVDTDINTIKKNIEPYICKIYNNKTDYENGFLCKIPYPCRTSYMNVLITSNKISQKNAFKICFRDDKIKKFISNFPERNIYQSEKYNLKFIEIFPDKDDLHDFLEFEEDTINEDTINIKNMNIFMSYYSNETLSYKYWKSS